MNTVLKILLVIVLNSAWFLPLFLLRGKSNAAHGRYAWFSLGSAALMGLLVSALVSNFGNKLFTDVLHMNVNSPLYIAAESLVCAGLTEEAVKFLCGLLFIRLAKPARKVDYVLIMGAAGLGFALAEDIMYSLAGDYFGVLLRGIIPFHMVLQFYMGARLYEADQAKAAGNLPLKRKSLCLALLIPVLTHGVYDFFALSIDGLLKNPATTEGSMAYTVGIVLYWTLVAVSFAFCVFMEVRAAKLVKESRALPPTEESIPSAG